MSITKLASKHARVVNCFLSTSTLSLLLGCSSNKDDDSLDPINQVPTIAPIEAVVKTSVPLSYAAEIAMAAVNGTVFPQVSLSNTCSTFPCVATMVITVQPNDIPVVLDGISDNGEIFVVGLWSSSSQAILTVIFDGINAGNQYQFIRKISTIPVSQLNNITTVAYANIDIDIASDSEVSIDLNAGEIQTEYDRLNQSIDTDPELNINLEAWIVETNSNGTPNDLSDDQFSIVGGGQYFEANANEVSVLQIGAVDIQMTTNCALNPVGGLAVLQEVRVSSGDRATWPVLGQALIEFHSSCDGNARVILGIGSFFLATGDDIDLGFND